MRIGARSQNTGKTAFTTAEIDGRFEFDDTFEPGVYDVVVLEDLEDPDNRRKPTIAAKYRDANKSGISVNVAAGDTAELNLKLDPP